MTFLAKDKEIIDRAWASHAGHQCPELSILATRSPKVKGRTLAGLLVRKFREGQLFLKKRLFHMAQLMSSELEFWAYLAAQGLAKAFKNRQNFPESQPYRLEALKIWSGNFRGFPWFPSKKTLFRTKIQ